MIQKNIQTDDDNVDVVEPKSYLESFFEYLNIDFFFEKVTYQTNFYYVQKRNDKSVKTSTKEIRKLVRLHETC